MDCHYDMLRLVSGVLAGRVVMPILCFWKKNDANV
jgi:hypothetical protein